MTRKVAIYIGMKESVTQFEKSNKIVFETVGIDYSEIPLLRHFTYVLPKKNESNMSVGNNQVNRPCGHETTSTVIDLNEVELGNKNRNTIPVKNKAAKNELDRVACWKLIGLIMDRLLFWIFFPINLFTSMYLLVLLPILKRSDFI